MGNEQPSYALKEKKGENLDSFIVTITADSNDADYITTEDTFSKEEFESRTIHALNHLHNFGSGSHELEDYPNVGDLDIPRSDWGRCHSLQRVKVQYVDKNCKIFNVSLNYTKLPEDVKNEYLECDLD